MRNPIESRSEPSFYYGEPGERLAALLKGNLSFSYLEILEKKGKINLHVVPNGGECAKQLCNRIVMIVLVCPDGHWITDYKAITFKEGQEIPRSIKITPNIGYSTNVN